MRRTSLIAPVLRPAPGALEAVGEVDHGGERFQAAASVGRLVAPNQRASVSSAGCAGPGASCPAPVLPSPWRPDLAVGQPQTAGEPWPHRLQRGVQCHRDDTGPVGPSSTCVAHGSRRRPGRLPPARVVGEAPRRPPSDSFEHRRHGRDHEVVVVASSGAHDGVRPAVDDSATPPWWIGDPLGQSHGLPIVGPPVAAAFCPVRAVVPGDGTRFMHQHGTVVDALAARSQSSPPSSAQPYRTHDPDVERAVTPSGIDGHVVTAPVANTRVWSSSPPAAGSVMANRSVATMATSTALLHSGPCDQMRTNFPRVTCHTRGSPAPGIEPPSPIRASHGRCAASGWSRCGHVWQHLPDG